MKGKQQSRSVRLHQKAQDAIWAWVASRGDNSKTYFFRSRIAYMGKDLMRKVEAVVKSASTR